MNAPVTVTYYLEILSSWCHWAEPAWSELKKRYAGRVEFRWKIALMNPSDFPVSQAQCDWFYRRSGTIMRSPTMLNSGWLETKREGVYLAPNLVAEASKDVIDPADDRIRLALSQAALIEGKKIGDLDTAVGVAASLLTLHPAKLRAAAESSSVKARLDTSTAEFHAHRVTQRPTFIVESAIGDKAVFSGLARIEPLAATIDAILKDAHAYATHAVHFGNPPAE